MVLSTEKLAPREIAARPAPDKGKRKEEMGIMRSDRTCGRILIAGAALMMYGGGSRSAEREDALVAHRTFGRIGEGGIVRYASGDGSDGNTAPAKLPELVSVRRIWSKAPHNAFTDLIRFQGKWFCVFREGRGHASLDGKIRVIASGDGKEWTSAALLTTPDPRLPDMRDAKLSITPEGKLMLVSAASHRKRAAGKTVNHYRTYSYFSADGRQWGKPTAIGEENFWLWRVTWHKGIAYSNGYTVTGPRFIRLYTSRDGRTFKTLVERVRNNVGEDSLVFVEDGTCYCLARPSSLGVSRPPYTQWSWKHLKGIREFGGPHMIRLPGGRFVAAGRCYDEKRRPNTSLLWLDVKKPALRPLLTLPSGGDTSYPGLVFHEGLLWVSYYSSHEGKTSIYLAKVKLPPARGVSGSGQGMSRNVSARARVGGRSTGQTGNPVDPADPLRASMRGPGGRLGAGTSCAAPAGGPSPGRSPRASPARGRGRACRRRGPAARRWSRWRCSTPARWGW